ncbi:MAG: NTP transferase domain-containing protein [Thermoleophilia bacterium]|nr:NTP transferase domain-containing protein [Thermoleophilia bacterium]
MKAVVMAGGEGTRLRPLTSNQPKPMVPIVNKPCMEHIIELLKQHDLTDIIVTLAFLPQSIRGYFGDGSSMGVSIEYSVEESPLGTAGSVRNAFEHLDETFIVISGDALTDFNLTEVIDFHKSKGSMITLALKSVENPLEFGVVIVDEDKHIKQFLEKPSWGQVFSDYVNTGIYVLEPEIFDYIAADTKYDFSQELFPKMLKRGKPMYGYPCEGYWQDIGNINQFLRANHDALDGKVSVNIPGIKLRENIYIGEKLNLDSLDNIRGPALIGNYAKIDTGAKIQPYTILGNNVVVKDNAEIDHSVIDSNTYIGSGAKVSGAIIGKNCDIKPSATIHANAALGDECSIGDHSMIASNVKIYPFKVIEAGAQVYSSIIWEWRALSTLFGKDGVTGLVNVDITSELALKLAMAYGTTLDKGAPVSCSRDEHPASRMIKRAIGAGLNSTGVNVRDLRVTPASVNRFDLKCGNAVGGIHVRVSAWHPEVMQILFFEPPGSPIGEGTERDIEKYYNRHDYRRAFYTEIGKIIYPVRTTEEYIQGLLATWDVDKIRNRRFRFVLDHSYSSASLIASRLLSKLGAEIIAINTFLDEDKTAITSTSLEAESTRLQKLVVSAGADLGITIDNAAEKIFLVDENGNEISPEQTLFLLLKLMASSEGQGKIALPLTVSRLAEMMVEGTGCEILRTKVSQAALTEAAARPDVIFAGAVGGDFIFPGFLPAHDALMSMGKVLELLAVSEKPLSELVAQIPETTLLRETKSCPWSLKGVAMREISESIEEEENVSRLDGIKVFHENGWAQVLPSPDEPLFEIYAEGDTIDDSKALLERYAAKLDEIIATHEHQED